MGDHADDSSTVDMPNGDVDVHGTKTKYPSAPLRGRPSGTAAATEPKRSRRHSSGSGGPAATLAHNTAPAAPPCGACKFLRRRCVSGCVFAPHFGPEQGAARFAAVHKVFGASNVSKLLHHVSAARRGDAAVTICYEAQARLSDPVYGCVSTIIALQHQVALLHAELSMVQMQLLSSRVATENTASCFQQQQQQVVASLWPAYSKNSSASTTLPSLRCSLPSGLGFAGAAAAPPLRLSQPSSHEDVTGDEEGSRDSFVDDVLSRK